MILWLKKLFAPKKIKEHKLQGPQRSWCPFCGSYCGEHNPDIRPIQTVRCPGCHRDLFT